MIRLLGGKEHSKEKAGALLSTVAWRREQYPDHGFNDLPQVGFIAQEVKAVRPEIVAQGSDGYHSVDYGRITLEASPCRTASKGLPSSFVQLRTGSGSIKPFRCARGATRRKLRPRCYFRTDVPRRFGRWLL